MSKNSLVRRKKKVISATKVTNATNATSTITNIALEKLIAEVDNIAKKFLKTKKRGGFGSSNKKIPLVPVNEEISFDDSIGKFLNDRKDNIMQLKEKLRDIVFDEISTRGLQHLSTLYPPSKDPGGVGIEQAIKFVSIISNINDLDNTYIDKIVVVENGLFNDTPSVPIISSLVIINMLVNIYNRKDNKIKIDKKSIDIDTKMYEDIINRIIDLYTLKNTDLDKFILLTQEVKNIIKIRRFFIGYRLRESYEQVKNERKNLYTELTTKMTTINNSKLDIMTAISENIKKLKHNNIEKMRTKIIALLEKLKTIKYKCAPLYNYDENTGFLTNSHNMNKNDYGIEIWLSLNKQPYECITTVNKEKEENVTEYKEELRKIVNDELKIKDDINFRLNSISRPISVAAFDIQFKENTYKNVQASLEKVISDIYNHDEMSKLITNVDVVNYEIIYSNKETISRFVNDILNYFKTSPIEGRPVFGTNSVFTYNETMYQSIIALLKEVEKNILDIEKIDELIKQISNFIKDIEISNKKTIEDAIEGLKARINLKPGANIKHNIDRKLTESLKTLETYLGNLTGNQARKGGKLAANYKSYKSTGKFVYILYKKKRIKRYVYVKAKGRGKYCKIDKEYILLSKLKVV